MNKIVLRIALFVSALTFALCLVGGVSVGTSLVRTLIVFLGVLVVFILAAFVLGIGTFLLVKNPEVKQ